MSSTEAF